MYQLAMFPAFFSAFDSDAIHLYTPMGRLFEEIYAAQQSTFAGTAPADQAYHFTRLYIQADIFDDMQPPEIFIQIGDPDDGIHLTISSCKPGLNTTLDECKDKRHHPIKTCSDDQGFQVVKFSSSDSGCA